MLHPNFSESETFQAERQLRHLDSQENQEIPDPEAVSFEPIDAAIAMILEENLDFNDQMLGQNRVINWPKLVEESRTMAECEMETDNIPESWLKNLLIETFWKTSEIILQTRTRNGLSLRLDQINNQASTPELSKERAEIIAQFDQLNIISAEWQNNVTRIMFALSNQPEFHLYLTEFWANFDKIAKALSPDDTSDTDGLKQGVLGSYATSLVLEKLGYDVYPPIPEQDALQKIDLWAKRGEETIAIQVKSHKGMSFSFSPHRHIIFPNVNDYPTGERREIRNVQRFLTNVREYGIKWNRQIIPIWVDISGYGGEGKIDDEKALSGQLPLEPEKIAGFNQLLLAEIQRGGPDD